MSRVGQVWEVPMNGARGDRPPRVLLFYVALEDDGYNMARYRTFDLMTGETDTFEEYYHYPLEKHAKWSRLD